MKKSYIFGGIVSIYIIGFLYFLFFPEHYFRDMLINFVPYILLLHILFFFFFFLFSKERTRNAFLFFLVVSITLQTINLFSPYYHPLSTFSTSEKQISIKVLSLNILKSNTQYGEILSLIEKEKPEVISFLEFTNRFSTASEDLKKNYPYQLKVPADNGFGIALVSKHPFEKSQIEMFAGNIPYLDTIIQKENRSIRVIAVHPLPPMTNKMYEDRNISLELLAQSIEKDSSTIVMGDFNLTPWSQFHKKFVKDSSLRNCRKMSNGIQMSWYGMGFLLPIDHIFISKNITANDFRIGPNVNSDHYPLIADLQVSGL